MLEVKIDGYKGIFKIEVQGRLEETMADITTLLSVIYEKLDKKELKDLFEDCIDNLAKEKLYARSNEEIEELAKKKKEEIKKTEKEIKEVKEELMKLLEKIFK